MAVDFEIQHTRDGAEMTGGTADSLVNNLFFSLKIRTGSWWFAPDFGSRLHEIKKVTDESVRLAKKYTEDATRWIIALGRATAIDVETERATTGRRINLRLSVTRPDGEIVPYSTFIEVV